MDAAACALAGSPSLAHSPAEYTSASTPLSRKILSASARAMGLRQVLPEHINNIVTLHLNYAVTRFFQTIHNGGAHVCFRNAFRENDFDALFVEFSKRREEFPADRSRIRPVPV
jgi:hypothetical protein